jgi:uncharacterized protein YceK
MLSRVSRLMMVVFVTLAIAISGCGSASPSTSQRQGADAFCAGSTYTQCVPNLSLALQQGWKRVAICEYPNGGGDIVRIEEGNTAAGACDHLARSQVVSAKEIDLP